MRINSFLERSAARLPHKTALICGPERWTYEAVDGAANNTAAALVEYGIRPRDRVAIFIDNSIEAAVTIFGALKAGAVFLVLNPTMRARKLNLILRDSGARILVTQATKTRVFGRDLNDLPDLSRLVVCGSGAGEGSIDPFIRDNRRVTITPWSSCIEPQNRTTLPSIENDTDLAALIYTSGSTGQPKGVMSTHANMAAAITSITTYLENTEDDIVLNVLPLSFDYGLYQILMTFAFGGTVILEKSFAYPFKIIERLVAERVTGFPIVPTMAAILLRMKNLHRYDFSSLRYITNTAAALSPAQSAGLQQLFPRTRIYSMYGLTECKRVSYLPPGRLREKPASVGIPMPGTRVAIVDETGREVAPGATGELVIRGPNVMQGYWNAPEETARVFRTGDDGEERVLYSGDLFRRDEEGFLYFVGRKDDQLKTMGERVSPKEIEAVLCALPAVSEAAVIGVPDEIAGHAIKAVIVPAPEARITAQDIIKYCRTHLEPFMIPKYVEFVESLPLTPHGKFDKAYLERKHREEQGPGQ